MFLASRVDGVTGEDNVCKMWHDHYSNLLNSNSNTTYKSYVESAIKSVGTYRFNKLCYYDINDAIKDLKIGKSADIDNLQSEHFKYADQTLSCLLCMVFNAMLLMVRYHINLWKQLLYLLLKTRKVLLLTRTTTIQ